MSGLSEALVATAVGIFVAIPAVVAFNHFNRQLKARVTAAEALAHAVASHLVKDEVRSAALARVPPFRHVKHVETAANAA
jgi:biopolymer transport protein ExbB